jgi:hypothetical protein
MSDFGLIRDISGLNTFLRATTQDKVNTTLAAGVAQSYTLPLTANTTNQKWAVIFSYEPGATVWVAVNQTAAVPGASFAVATSELNPVGYRLSSSDVISLITADTSAVVGITYYAV